MNSPLDDLRSRRFGLVICTILEDVKGCEIRAAPGCPVGHGCERQRLHDAEEMQATLSAHMGRRGLFSADIVAAMQWAIPVVEPSARRRGRR